MAEEYRTWRGVGGIPAFTKTQLKDYFGMNEALIKKLDDPDVKIRTYEWGTFEGYKAEYIYAVLQEEWMQQELEAIRQRREKRIASRSARSVPVTDSNIAEALYIINKSAKKSRDTKQRAYYQCAHQICHSSKTRANKLYNLKDDVLSKLIREGKATYAGVHVQKNDYSVTFLKMYSFDGYIFHIPCGPHDFDRKEIIGVIEGPISAEVTRDTKINFTQAMQVLSDYMQAA